MQSVREVREECAGAGGGCKQCARCARSTIPGSLIRIALIKPLWLSEVADSNLNGKPSNFSMVAAVMPNIDV